MTKEERYVILANLFFDLWASADFESDFQAEFPEDYQLLIDGKQEAVSDSELCELEKWECNYYGV